jgi:hypothetical protein
VIRRRLIKGSLIRWLNDHVDLSRNGTDVCLHMCIRFGKVRRVFLVHPDGNNFTPIYNADILDQVAEAKSWMEAMAIIRRGQP